MLLVGRECTERTPLGLRNRSNGESVLVAIRVLSSFIVSDGNLTWSSCSETSVPEASPVASNLGSAQVSRVYDRFVPFSASFRLSIRSAKASSKLASLYSSKSVSSSVIFPSLALLSKEWNESSDAFTPAAIHGDQSIKWAVNPQLISTMSPEDN